MTAAKVIQELATLPPDEQAKVIQYAFELARRRQLSPDELGDLAERRAEAFVNSRSRIGILGKRVNYLNS